MRTHGFRSRVLLALVAAVGVVASLGRPWYAAAPPPADDEPASIGSLHGPVDALFGGIARWFADSAGTTGWDALGPWATALAALAALTAVTAAACLVASLQGIAREGLRYGALACLGLTLWKLLDPPGPNAALELRQGAFLAAAAALVAVACGSAVASAPLHRRQERGAYVPPAPPAASSPPPGL